MRESVYDLYLARTTHVDNWDLVDTSADRIVGPHLDVVGTEVLDELAGSALLWERRIAMIAPFHRIKRGEAATTLTIARRLLSDGEAEPLLHKAAGWMLREVGKRIDEALLTDFLDAHARGMPALMLASATERLSPEQRAAYRALRTADSAPPNPHAESRSAGGAAGTIPRVSLQDQRRAYRRGALDDAITSHDPLATLEAWIAEARADGDPESSAMALATVDPDGQPAVRYVLCKGVSDRGVTFFTNVASRKGHALAHEPRAAVSFWWPGLERSVRITGTAELLPREQVHAYFAARPRGSRIGAFASRQSRPIASRAELEAQGAEADAEFPSPGPEHAPDDWGGYELVAGEVELWQGRDDRLHDRFRFTRDAAGSPWRAERLQP
ncbi:MAG: pyridoxamine 5'-phosphate oxidase [Patulibacter minatonensis]